VTFYNEMARYAYEEKRRMSSPEYRQQQAARAHTALLERVPERLPGEYCVIEVSTGRTIIKSDSVRHLAACACVKQSQIRLAIDSGQPFRRGTGMCQGDDELLRVERAHPNG